MADILFFDLHARWKCPFFPYTCTLQIASFAGHTPMWWLGHFAHLEHIVFLDGPLPRPMSETLLFGPFDVFAASVGNCLVSSPWRKTCCWWTVSACRIHVKAFPDWDHHHSSAVVLIMFSHKYRVPGHSGQLIMQGTKLQYLAKAYACVCHRQKMELALPLLVFFGRALLSQRHVPLLHEVHVCFKPITYHCIQVSIVIRQPERIYNIIHFLSHCILKRGNLPFLIL